MPSASPAVTGQKGPTKPFVLFESSDAAFAIPAGAVREILPRVSFSRPPRAPDILAGFLSLDEKALPVLDVRRLLGLPVKDVGPYAHLLILEALVLQVDRVLEVRAFRAEAFLPLREKHSLNDCVVAEAMDRDRAVHLLDPARLLLEEERTRIAQLNAIEQERLAGLHG